MGEEENLLLEAIEKVRRDKHQPWRYILFTFLNGLAQGLGVALGATLVLGIVIFILTRVLASMINFPVIGDFFNTLMQIMESSARHAPRVR